VKQGSVLQQCSGGPVSSVELTGPILPHCVAGLARLFAHTSRGNFTATFGGVHDPTVSFNSLSDCDVSSSLLEVEQSLKYQQLLPSDVCHTANLGKHAVRELVCANGLYTWTC